MKKTLIIIFSIFLPIFLLLLSYQIVLIFNSFNLTSPQEETINFLSDNKTLALNYTALELSHLQDVQGVMKWANYLFYFSLLVCSLILTFYRKEPEQLKKLLYYGGMATLISLGIILLFSILNFNFIFTIFHQLFFPQGNWLFPADSLLIHTFPEQFFMRISWEIFGLTILLALALIIVGRNYCKNSTSISN